MSDKNLSEAEKKFLAFDWSKSAEWQTYFSNLYPTPDASKVPKFKRTWFRRNVDSTLSEESTVGDVAPPRKESTSGSKPSVKWPTSGLFDKFQARTRLPLVKEFVLRLELVLLLGFLLSTLIVVTGRFRAPGSENLVKNSVTVSKSFFMLFLLVGFFREKGLPQFNAAWFNALLGNQHVHYLMYGLTFLTVPPRLFYYLPQLLTAVLSLSSMYKNYPSVFPRLLQNQTVKQNLSRVEQSHYSLYKLRGHLEVAMVPYLALTAFAGRSNMVPMFLYFSFLKFKVNAKDVYVMNTLKGIHMAVTNALSNPKVPAGFRTTYQKVVKGLELYFTGRRR